MCLKKSLDTFLSCKPDRREQKSHSFPTMPIMIRWLLIALFCSLIVVDAKTWLKKDSPLQQLHNSRIVGGQPGNIQQFPYHVSVEYRGGNLCGGSILSPLHVLTAASCTDGLNVSGLSVRAGTAFHAEGGQVVQVSEIKQHTNFNATSFDYNVSILKLTSPVPLGTSIAVALVEPLEPSAGLLTTVTGWGIQSEGGSDLPEQLYFVDLPIVGRNDCRNAYSTSAITDRMICAGGYAEGGKDSCRGDRGGPLVIKSSRELPEVGLSSWGNGCGRPGTPGVYTNLANSEVSTFIAINIIN